MRRYKKAPILEAVIEFRWSSTKSIEELSAILLDDVFQGFEEPKPRQLINASLNVDAGEVSHDRKHVGFEVTLRDGSETVFLEENKFVFVKRAPYDRWEDFSARALSLLKPAVSSLKINEFSRVGVRFVNRIDTPSEGESVASTDSYVNISFNGPRKDRGLIEEFQMRVVKPTEKLGIHYALVVATMPSPLPAHSAIILDIDVFTKRASAASGSDLLGLLEQMRDEKNEIFEECVTDQARELFGGLEV